jgi:uncharacterized DUF497 family protein
MVDGSIFAEVSGFDWDEHKVPKNREKHGVEAGECEEAFFNRPFVVADDQAHSETERRFYALGSSVAGRRLFIVFTIRNHLVRVISARDMSRKERRLYEQGQKAAP